MDISQVLELGVGVLSKLLNMVKSNFTEEAIKALYAVSAVIRNNAHGQELFFAEAGDLMLQVDGRSNENSKSISSFNLPVLQCFVTTDCHSAGYNE